MRYLPDLGLLFTKSLLGSTVLIIWALSTDWIVKDRLN